jgi:hypothetical protein
MPRDRRTIARDSVFRVTDTSMAGANRQNAIARRQDPPPPAPRRRSAGQDQARFQTAVWLGEEEVEWLDNRCLEIRRSGWRSVTRSAMIRALIRAAIDKPLDLRGVADEEELTERLSIVDS